MARGKNTTALFDVIHAAKKPPKSSPSAAMPTPRWWAKDKMKLTAVVPPVGETAGKQGSWLASVKRSIGPATPAAAEAVPVSRDAGREISEPQRQPTVESFAAEPAATQPTESHEAVASEPAAVEAPTEPVSKPVTSVRWMARSVPAAPAETSGESEGESDETPPLVAEVKTRFRDRARAADESAENGRRSARAEPPVAAVDRDAREVSFRLSYAGLIGLAVIVVLAMALAFVVGGHYYAMVNEAKAKPANGIGSTASGSSANGAILSAVGTTKPPTASPALAPAPNPAPNPGPNPEYRPSVADPRPRTTTTMTPTITQTPAAPPTNTRPAPRTAASKTPAIDDPRIPGRFYVVIKSYPDEDGDAAAKTAALLNANGIPCSVVRGLKNFVPRGSFSVVGYQPFKSATDADCIEYGKKLDALRPKFAGISRQPGYPAKLYAWLADAEQG
jgi:hypothetical protein